MKRVAVALALALALASCTRAHGLTVSARFSDVGDLAPSAPVMMSDVRIGSVKSIKLEGYQALVTMSLDPRADVPQGVTARVRRTSLLGERIIDVVIPDGLPANAPPLHDGDVITTTEVRPDLEDLVREGVQVLGPISASEVATLVNEGYKGFGGKGAEIRTLLDNFRTIVGAYAQRTGEIRSLILSLNQLNTTLAAHAEAQGQAIVNQERALHVLRDQSIRLEAALKALNRLAVAGAGIMEAHSDQMSRFFKQMRVILGVLKAEQDAITGLLRYAPEHNRNTQLVEFAQFNQVLQDFVICGFNEDPNNPARSCSGGMGTQ